MSKFLTQLRIDCHPRTDFLFVLAEPLIYESDIIRNLGSVRSDIYWAITVPAGFTCDLASTSHKPLVSMLWGNQAHREGVLHDYLYRIDSEPQVDRSVADSVFLEAMVVRNKPFYVRWPLYAGVRMWGYWSYHKKLVKWTG
jgi:hypothetical protein